MAPPGRVYQPFTNMNRNSTWCGLMIRSWKDVMSADLPDALAKRAAVTGVRIQAERWPWVETALAAFLVTAAVLFVSFLSVATNL
jgi:hypothetical protein